MCAVCNSNPARVKYCSGKCRQKAQRQRDIELKKVARSNVTTSERNVTTKGGVANPLTDNEPRRTKAELIEAVNWYARNEEFLWRGWTFGQRMSALFTGDPRQIVEMPNGELRFT